jgi:hypothetical protein
VLALVAALALGAATKNTDVWLPTSTAVAIASRIAAAEHLPIRSDWVNLLDTLDARRPALPGFISLALYHNGWIQNAFSISEATGQIVERNQCVLYAYPFVRAFEREVQDMNETKPIPVSILARRVGCDTLKLEGANWKQHTRRSARRKHRR